MGGSAVEACPQQQVGEGECGNDPIGGALDRQAEPPVEVRGAGLDCGGYVAEPEGAEGSVAEEVDAEDA